MTAARIYRVILPVSDLERATQFYQHLLNDTGARISAGRHYFDCGGVILASDGGLPMGAIATRPWGERSFYMRDPGGNPLCFVDEQTLFTTRPQ